MELSQSAELPVLLAAAAFVLLVVVWLLAGSRKRRKARTAIKRHRVRWRYVSEATEKKIAERKAAAAAASEGRRHS